MALKVKLFCEKFMVKFTVLQVGIRTLVWANQVHFGVLELKSEASFSYFYVPQMFSNSDFGNGYFWKVTIFGKFLFSKLLKTSSGISRDVPVSQAK